jgi:hypothetical protein
MEIYFVEPEHFYNWACFDLHTDMREDTHNLMGPLDRARFQHWAAIDS